MAGDYDQKDALGFINSIGLPMISAVRSPMGSAYDQKDAFGFINLIGLPTQVWALAAKAKPCGSLCLCVSALNRKPLTLETPHEALGRPV